MFENIGWAEILVLVVAGLFILGPERLPEAAQWLGKAIKQVRDYATGARDHLRKELGPEFDQIQQPLNDLRGLRSFSPRAAITKTLFDGDDPLKPNGWATTANGSAASVTPPAAGGAAAVGGAAAAAANGAPTPAPAPAPQKPLDSNERPPIDPDAT